MNRTGLHTGCSRLGFECSLLPNTIFHRYQELITEVLQRMEHGPRPVETDPATGGLHHGLGDDLQLL